MFNLDKNYLTPRWSYSWNQVFLIWSIFYKPNYFSIFTLYLKINYCIVHTVIKFILPWTIFNFHFLGFLDKTLMMFFFFCFMNNSFIKWCTQLSILSHTFQYYELLQISTHSGYKKAGRSVDCFLNRRLIQEIWHFIDS